MEVLQLLRVTFGIQEAISEIREEASDDSAIEFGELPDRKEVDSDSYDVNEELSVRCRKQIWVGSMLVSIAKGKTQVLESLLDLVEFLLTEHVGLVYIMLFKPSARDDLEVCQQRFKHPGVLRRSCRTMAEPSFCIHRRLMDNLNYFAHCNHTNLSLCGYPCLPCCEIVRKELVNVRRVNPVVSRFLFELLCSGTHISQERHLAKVVSKCMTRHIEKAEDFFRVFDNKISPEFAKLWELYASVTETPIEDGTKSGVDVQNHAEMDDVSSRVLFKAKALREDQEASGLCFPGRRPCRPGIVFEGLETHHCAKKYRRSDRHSPGLLTVQ